MSHIMRKPDYCLCEIKGTDRPPSNCEADYRLCFHFMDTTIPLLKSEISVFFCTGWLVSDLVGIPNFVFSCSGSNRRLEDIWIGTFKLVLCIGVEWSIGVKCWRERETFILVVKLVSFERTP